jgi:pimeloyl-ACP methyl ester carboxylesterase
MTTHRVTGGGGTELHVVETGNPQGRPILFIHGFSQCSLSWRRQLESDLTNNHRLVAMDLRGHGQSERPQDGYDDSKLWADDVHAVIQSLQLQQPILCGWSYGPLVILDYVRHYGEGAIAGMHFVGGISKLGSEAALSVLTPEFLGAVPALLSEDAAESSSALESLLDMCFGQHVSNSERRQMLDYNVSVPPRVRQALLARAFDNDDLLPAIRKPVLLTYGTAEEIVKPIAAEQHKAAMPHAEVHTPDAGHAPFWTHAADFNQRLSAFAENAAASASSLLSAATR